MANGGSRQKKAPSGVTPTPKIPSGSPASASPSNVFPWEEKLRGQSRSGKFVLPKPTFTQPDSGVNTAGGEHLTPDYNPSTKSGNLKFETDTGLGKI